MEPRETSLPAYLRKPWECAIQSNPASQLEALEQGQLTKASQLEALQQKQAAKEVWQRSQLEALNKGMSPNLRILKRSNRETAAPEYLCINDGANHLGGANLIFSAPRTAPIISAAPAYPGIKDGANHLEANHDDDSRRC